MHRAWIPVGPHTVFEYGWSPVGPRALYLEPSARPSALYSKYSEVQDAECPKNSQFINLSTQLYLDWTTTLLKSSKNY